MCVINIRSLLILKNLFFALMCDVLFFDMPYASNWMAVNFVFLRPKDRDVKSSWYVSLWEDIIVWYSGFFCWVVLKNVNDHLIGNIYNYYQIKNYWLKKNCTIYKNILFTSFIHKNNLVVIYSFKINSRLETAQPQ